MVRRSIDFESAFQQWKGTARYNKGKDYIVLDLGHDSMNALYAKIGADGELTVLDYASSTNTGYSAGSIVDQKQFQLTLSRVVGNLRKRNKLRIKNLNISLSAPFISYYPHFATANLPSRKRVTRKLVDEVVHSTRGEISSLVEHVIQVVPVRFALDSIYSGSEPPLGMSGNQLGVDLMFITAPKASLQQIERSLKKSGYNVSNWWCSGIAAAESVVVPNSETGVAVVDIGAGSTDVAVYQYGRLLHVGVIACGGREIDSDLAVYLNESITVAEEVKRLYGCALPQIIKHNEAIDLRERGMTAKKLISAREVAGVIKNRAQEILFSIDEEIGKALSQQQISRVIFTGGTSKIPGFIHLAEDILDRSVELGIPTAVRGTRLGFTDPCCASLIGTLRSIRKSQLLNRQLEPAAMTSSQKVKSWFDALVSTPIAEQRELQ